jgi:hypothetical protein
MYFLTVTIVRRQWLAILKSIYIFPSIVRFLYTLFWAFVEQIYAEGTRLLRQVYSYPLWWCGTHTLEEDHTHPLLAMPWVGRVWASNRVKSVSFYLARKQIVLYASCLTYSSNKRHWIIWVVLLYFTWELNKDSTVTEDPSRYPGVGPSTIQPQHICSSTNLCK